jgi:DNA-binding Lrp family transcriptional regulator
MRAYVLIEIHTGEVQDVVHQLSRIEGVIEANMTFGPYDAVAILEADHVDRLGSIIATKIQSIPGVQNTITCLAVEF